MPLVEIEDTELQRLQQEAAASAPYRQVWGKVLASKNKLKALELAREEFPDLPIPELDTAKAAAQPILDQIEAMKKEHQEYREAVEAREKERAEREKETAVKSTIASSRRKLKSEGWDDEGIEKIETLMQERGIGDYDVAAAYVRSQLPAPSPLVHAYEGKDLNWFNPAEGEPDHKLLMDNPSRFKGDMVKKFFTDRAAGNKAAWAA
jgi:hypothetical protein